MKVHRRATQRFVPKGLPWACHLVDLQREIRVTGTLEDLSWEGAGARLESKDTPWEEGDRVIIRANSPSSMAPLRIHAVVRNVRYEVDPVIGLEIQPWCEEYDRIRDRRLGRLLKHFASEKVSEIPEARSQVKHPIAASHRLKQQSIAERNRVKSKDDLAEPTVF